MLKPVFEVILDEYQAITGSGSIDELTARAIETAFIAQTKHFLIDPRNETEMEILHEIIRNLANRG